MLPSVSIVVPTCNRPASLAVLLEALAEQDYPRELMEVVVVDDGSLPPVEVCRERLRVQVARLEGAGPAAARNAGVELASGTVIAMTDDDCVPRRDWLRQLIRVWMTAPEALVGGATVAPGATDVYAGASQLLVNYLAVYFAGSRSGNEFFPAMNLACRRDRFLQLGGFDETFTLASEDRDLCDRWKARGALVAATDAVVEHRQVTTAVGFLQRHFRYGRGARLLRVRRLRRGEEKFRLEPGAFYRGLIVWPFRVEPWYRAPLTCGLLLTSQVCSAAGYLFEANATRMKEAVRRLSGTA